MGLFRCLLFWSIYTPLFRCIMSLIRQTKVNQSGPGRVKPKKKASKNKYPGRSSKQEPELTFKELFQNAESITVWPHLTGRDNVEVQTSGGTYGFFGERLYPNNTIVSYGYVGLADEGTSILKLNKSVETVCTEIRNLFN